MKIAYDTIVKTADGTVCRVGYVDSDRREAYVKPIEGDRLGDELVLPLRELKRITDPRRKLPPIEGMPETPRPRCQYCDKPLDPIVSTTFNTNTDRLLSPRVIRRVFNGWSGYGSSDKTYPHNGTNYYVPLFHSTKCAMKFAQASWIAGMRIKR